MPTPRQGRPGARRPGATAPSGGRMTAADQHALPDFVEDGEKVSLDPAEASLGGLSDEDVVIVGAQFKKFTYNNRPDLAPQLDLFVQFKREGFDEPTEKRYRYVDWQYFAPSKDGNFVNLRNKGDFRRPWKYSGGTQFIQSLIESGFSKEKIDNEGISSIVGLKVHVSNRVGTGAQPDSTKNVLVDTIYGADEGASSEAPSPGAAPAASSDSEVAVDAEAALLQLLAEAENNTLQRPQIATAFIRHADWKEHANKAAILQELRKDEFIVRDDAPWAVDGNTVTLG